MGIHWFSVKEALQGVIAQTSSLPPFSCSPNIYMMQGDSTNTGLYETLINSGSVTRSALIGTIQPNVNAIGFRVADGYLYGIRRSDDHLIRIGSDGSQQDLGDISGLPAATYNSGTFGPDGFLYVLGSLGGSSLQRINVDTVTRVVTGGSSPANTPDIAIPPGSAFAYGVIANGRAVRIPLAGGAGTQFGPDHNRTFGAAYSDLLGNVFLSENATNDIYQLNLTTGAITLVADADPDFSSSANDGVFCRSAVFPTSPIDYSDTPADGTSAPDGSSLTAYGQATHAVTSGIQLGAAIDADSASIASNDASGDGADDDGVTIPALTQGQSATIDIDVAGANGYLQGWIDWNGDGDFLGANEQIAENIQDDGSNGDTTANDGTINLPITVPATAITTNPTFARFRWSTAQNLNSTAAADDGEVEDYQVAIAAVSDPNVLLVKRITRINGQTTNGSTNLDTYVEDAVYPYDDNLLNTPAPDPIDTENWPNTTGNSSSTFLLGAINAGEVRPGDEVEYTIYFLSTGNQSAIDVQLCDKVPSFQTFVPDAFNSVLPAPSGGVGANRGISVEYNGNVFSYTNDADGDTAQYYPPGSTLPAACDNAPAQAEDNGAIVVNLGDLPQATGPGAPATSYGAIRFRGKVK